MQANATLNSSTYENSRCDSKSPGSRYVKSSSSTRASAVSYICNWLRRTDQTFTKCLLGSQITVSFKNNYAHTFAYFIHLIIITHTITLTASIHLVMYIWAKRAHIYHQKNQYLLLTDDYWLACMALVKLCQKKNKILSQPLQTFKRFQRL